MKKYSEEHLWVEVAGDLATVGVTAYAADELGDITFVELPEVGAVLTSGEPFCVIESAKAATDVIAPCRGIVAAVNAKLDDDPALVNSSPEQGGWICRLKEFSQTEVDTLMGEREYEAYQGKDEDED